MGSVKICLFLAVIISMVGRVYPVAGALGDACVSDACTDTTNHVCDTATSLCKVIADGVKTACAGDNAKCPSNAACATDVCNCNAGFIAIASGATTGLCTVQDADCSTDACGDTTNFVCDPDNSDVCKVKADGTATTCDTTDGNCVNDASCSTGGTTCSCNAGFREVSGLCVAVIDYTCSTDTECSTALANTHCAITYPCAQGTCQCASGFDGTDCTDLGYDKTCVQGGNDKCDINIGLACPAGLKCDCSNTAHTYQADVNDCTDKMVFGGTCTTAADCYIPSGSNGACTSTMCDCATGYVKDTATSGAQSCRRPYANEACSGTCVEVTITDILSGGETSQAAPTCTSNTCACGTGETLYSRKKGSVCHNFCLTDLASGTAELAAGATCTEFNACASKICAQCPGDANGKCYDAPCSGVGVNGNGIALCLSILLLSYFF